MDIPCPHCGKPVQVKELSMREMRDELLKLCGVAVPERQPDRFGQYVGNVSKDQMTAIYNFVKKLTGGKT